MRHRGDEATRYTRREFLSATGVLGGALLAGIPRSLAQTPAALLTVGTRTLEVNGKAATVFHIGGPGGRPGIFANEGDRFRGKVVNATASPLQLHWHGQIKAPFDQDRARPGGGAIAAGGVDAHDFELTPGTHWMHAHTLTEQQLLAAPMITREKNAGDVQDVVIILHDFAFRSPEEIMSELGGTDAHSGHGGATKAADPHAAHGPQAQGSTQDNAVATPHHSADQHGGHAAHGSHGHHHGSRGAGGGHAGHMMGAVHANDVRYDAYLANDRTLTDPEVVKVEKGARVRLRIINGATATAFFISTPGLGSECIAVDGSPCQPVKAERYPLAQGQRLDLLVAIPRSGGTFAVLASVEAADFQTGIVLATTGSRITKLPARAAKPQAHSDLSFESRLRATHKLAPRPAERTFSVMLGEEPGYRWTINGRVHGEHQPFQVRQGERVEMTFMNPTSMMHPMHMHGHHFQITAIAGRRLAGAIRDTVIVPPHVPVTVAFDAGHPGAWYLHCHHLYHMATGMMTEVIVS